MAPSRSSRPSGVWSFISLLVLLISLVTASSSPSSPSRSPAADIDLICNPTDPSDCYPKVFIPTDDFQPVRPDQDLPPGLHVRLNIYTGEREAKINVPDNSDSPSELDGLPVDSSIVVVNSEEPEPVIPVGAPLYEPVGKIKEPPKSDESDSFHASLDILGKGLDVDESLEQLEELSHDIYYGLKIAEQPETVGRLMCFAVGQDSGRARKAANTLAGALQNNVKALGEVERAWEGLRGVRCEGREGEGKSGKGDLGREMFRLLPVGEEDGEPVVVKARVAALKGLLKSEVLRREFLEGRGMDGVLEVLVSKTEPEWEAVREKIALLVQDIFLDGDLGASLGEWPVDDQLSERQCEMQEPRQECWDAEAGRLARQYRGEKGHWSQELWKKLREARKGVKSRERWRDEL